MQARIMLWSVIHQAYEYTVSRPDHILVVDDDLEIRSLLRTYLERHGYRVTPVPDGTAMWSQIEQSRIDLIILDLMLPGEDGLDLCRELRAGSRVPVIMLTARGDEMDRILGLEMGADDYLPKPFNPRELLARIKVVLKRTLAPSLSPEAPERSVTRFNDWQLDPVSRHLVSPEKSVVPLSGAEYRLLSVMLGHANRVLTRDQLLDLTQGRDADPFDRSIDVLVSRLRRRLREDPRAPEIIKTVRGEGYVLSARVTRGEERG